MNELIRLLGEGIEWYFSYFWITLTMPNFRKFYIIIWFFGLIFVFLYLLLPKEMDVPKTDKVGWDSVVRAIGFKWQVYWKASVRLFGILHIVYFIIMFIHLPVNWILEDYDLWFFTKMVIASWFFIFIPLFYLLLFLSGIALIIGIWKANKNLERYEKENEKYINKENEKYTYEKNKKYKKK